MFASSQRLSSETWCPSSCSQPKGNYYLVIQVISIVSLLGLSLKICQYSQNWAQTLANRDSGRFGAWNLAHSNCFANGYGENCAGALQDYSGRKPADLFYEEIRVHNFSNNAFYYPSGDLKKLHLDRPK